MLYLQVNYFFDKKIYLCLDIKIIESNLDNFVKINHQQSFADTVKDVLIADNKIYISYVREVSENCYGNNIRSEMNLSNIKFVHFFKNERVLWTLEVIWMSLIKKLIMVNLIKAVVE